MTAKESALAILKDLNLDQREELIRQLLELVAEQQNGPPYGGADGSLNEAEWTALRDGTGHLRCAIDAFRRVTRSKPQTVRLQLGRK